MTDPVVWQDLRFNLGVLALVAIGLYVLACVCAAITKNQTPNTGSES